MAKDKVTITLDRSKANRARSLTGARSVSEVIDVALERLIASETLRKDVAAYRRMPEPLEDLAIDRVADSAGLTDETDWEALYPDIEATR